MPDRNEVIRMLSNTLRHCHNLYNKVDSKEQSWLAEINEGSKEAIELLKEMEPASPEERAKHYKKWYRCKCRAEFLLVDERFCPYCGRAVKWG